ncbi:MOSC domain-containing protein [Haloechinothrix alba]|uniref:MOSC domain-containing protein n=1 Tax=Haloechinothrix alba TaxID=664784 RepID=UPI001595E60F|nr:MOSC domain-containing protein [Haloechinothrix alba]
MTGIFVAEVAAATLRSVDRVRVEPGRGIVGDRYHTGIGTWSYERRLWSDLTLVSTDALAVVAREYGVELSGAQTRRNIAVAGVDLTALVGKRFEVGGLECEGERECAPCRHLDQLTGQPARATLRARGGLRARVLSGGVLRLGDRIVPTN